MFHNFKALIAFVSICISFVSVIANANQVCGEGYTSTNSYAWCATVGSGDRAIYYLHGNGESERSWGTPTHLALQKMWAAQNPTVIRVSFGPTWFFTQNSAAEFVGQVAPQIEQKLSMQVGSRSLFGESMGGFNALQLYTFAPSFFARFVAACPAVLSFPPQASDKVVQAYIERHRPYVVPKIVTKWRDKMLEAYPSARAWAAHDPIANAAKKSSASPPLFMYSNGLDPFGFQEGAELLRQALSGAAAPLEFHHLPNTQHCETDAATLNAMGRFLMK